MVFQATLETPLFSPSSLAMELSDISDFKEVSDWWYILFAILFIDLVVILLVRHYPEFFGKTINVWYDKFGLNAVLADVLIIAVGFAIARYVYTYFLKNLIGWSPLYFTSLLVIVQMIHDFIFYVGVILPIPRGLNDMMDVFKDYSKAGGKIILADSAMMIGSALIAMLLKSQPEHITASFALLTSYALPYSLYTNA